MIYIKSANDEEYDHDIQNVYNNLNNKISNNDHTQNLRDDFIKCFKEIIKNNNENEYVWNLENSRSVITIKKSKNRNFIASFDIALIDIINNSIHIFDKTNNQMIWNELEEINQAYKDVNGLDSTSLKEEYLKLKHNQKDMSKNNKNCKSSSKLFIEAVNNVKNQNNT